MPKLSRSLIVFVSVFLILLLAAGVGWYFYNKAHTPSDAEQVVKAVGKLMELPNEEPTIATVSDVTKLQGQQFFAHAQNGDKVLVFQKAQRAILYRPSINKLIEVGPIQLTSTTNPAESSATNESLTPTKSSERVRIALYNGTSVAGLTKQVEKKLADAHEPFTVIAKENAAKDTYTDTIVIDLVGTKKEAAAQLAKDLGGKVASLPDGEEKPKDAELLVILGADYAQ